MLFLEDPQPSYPRIWKHADKCLQWPENVAILHFCGYSREKVKCYISQWIHVCPGNHIAVIIQMKTIYNFDICKLNIVLKDNSML